MKEYKKYWVTYKRQFSCQKHKELSFFFGNKKTQWT